MTAAAANNHVDIWRQRYESAPESRQFMPLADSLRAAGRYEEALALLEEGLVKHPDFTAGYVVLGQTLLDAGRPEHAGKVLRTVLTRDPQNARVLHMLTEEARSRGAWPEAIGFLEQLTVLEPDEARWTAALLEARTNAAVQDETDPPATSFATMTLVEIYLAQGYRAKAMTALRQMLVREPDRQDIQQKIAEIGILEEAGREGRDLQADEPGSGASPTVAYQLRRRHMAAKRAAEKKNFEEWIGRIKSDEEAAP